MDISRTMRQKRKAVRKLIESYAKEEEEDRPKYMGGQEFKFPPPPPPPDALPYGDVDTSESQEEDDTDTSSAGATRRRTTAAARHHQQLWQHRRQGETEESTEDSPLEEQKGGGGGRWRKCKEGVSWSSRGGRPKERGYRSDADRCSPSRLPPIGVFWDIENCQIPHGKSAVIVAQAVRDRFFNGFREAEFVVVCDVKKENPVIVQELNDAQVNLIHVASTSKNAADEKLRQSMRRFADIHGFPAAIILITGDINFASDLCDLRHRKKLHVILLHNSICSIPLILCANESYNFEKFILPLPPRGATKNWKNSPMELMVWNLPRGYPLNKLKERLKFLSYNCGGRITFVSESMAVVRFPSFYLASRAHKRMNGEVMYGNQIGVSYPQKAGTLKTDNNNFQGSGSLNGCGQPRNVIWNEYLLHESANGDGSQRKHPRSANYQEGASPSENMDSPWAWPSPNSNPPQVNGTYGGANKTNLVCNASAQEYFFGENISCGQFRIPSNGFNLKENDQSNRKDRGGFTTKNVVIESMKKVQKAASPQPLGDLTEHTSPWVNVRSTGTLRKSRTPSPYLAKSGQSRVSKKPDGVDTEKFFNPIQTANNSTPPIELHVTNLDQTIEPMEMKKILLAIFGEHVLVLHINVFVQSDGSFAASIKVPTIQDAQYAISQLHRRKIGFKRIVISHAHSTEPHSPQFIRWQVVTLLHEVPTNKLPLFKFLKLFESRYVTTISVSDLNRLKDVCLITDESGGRMVTLNPQLTNSPSPSLTSSQDVEPFCSRHCKLKTCFGKGWAEQEMPPLPNVTTPLREFSENLRKLLATHNNALPLSSFVNCYEEECGLLATAESGVPLEHLVTCVNKVELAIANGVKYLKSSPSRNIAEERSEDVSKCVSPSLVNQLNLFGRELVDLLRTQPHCLLLFNRLIPAYHHHFGRQCRVADYGFTKLIDLLEALPNVVQVMGEGNKRVVTLSYRAQVRRFTSDLLRVLKSQVCKRLILSELSQMFERTLGRPFDPVDYGLPTLSDLIEQVPEATVVVTREGTLTSMAIPKREQTQEEVGRTRQFAKEVVELLSHAPQCTILFHQFIPAYHHHYGHQCRVANFGFAKLIELFEAIPDIVKLDEDAEGERRVRLTPLMRLAVVDTQLCELVIPSFPPGLPLSSLASTFQWQFGFALKPASYGVSTLHQLISILSKVKIDSDEKVVPMESALVEHLMCHVRRYLLQSDEGSMSLSQLTSHFPLFHVQFITRDSLLSNLADVILIKDSEDGNMRVELSASYQTGRRLVTILNENGGCMSLSGLEQAVRRENWPLAGHTSLPSLLATLSSLVSLKGKGSRKHVILNKDLLTKKDGLPNGKAVRRPSSTNSLHSTMNFSNYYSEECSESPLKWNYDNIPVIRLPEMEALSPSELQLASYSLISPCKALLPPSARPMVAPHPSQLPPPLHLSPALDAKILKEKKEDGGMNKEEKQDNTVKRKLRLAAHFQTPIDLN